MLVQGRGLHPSACQWLTGEAGRLWRSLSPKFPYALLQDFKPGARGRISWRGDTGLSGLCTCPRTYRVPNTCHLECNVGKRKQTSSACKAIGLGREEGRESRPWSERGGVRGRCWGSHHQATAREGTAFLHQVLPAVVQRSNRQHPFLDQFLHYDALVGSHPVTPERAVPVWLFLRWSAVFSKIAWREPTRSEKC